MKKKFKLIVSILIILGILLSINIYLLYYLNQYTNIASVRLLSYENEEFTSNELDLFRDYDSVKIISGFKNTGEIRIEEPVSGRSALINETVVWGSAALVFDTGLLSGTYELWSAKQCLISNTAANALFKSENTEGLNLLRNGARLTVCGVFKHPEPVILTLADNKDDTFNGLEIIYQEGLEGSTEVKAMFHKAGIEKNIVMIDYNVYIGVCRMFFMFASYFFLYLAFNIIKEYHKGRFLYMLQILIFTFIVILLVGHTFRFPASFIPAKWSNFDFWADVMKEITGNWGDLKKATLTDKDYSFLGYVRLSMLTSIVINIILGIICIINLHRKFTLYRK